MNIRKKISLFFIGIATILSIFLFIIVQNRVKDTLRYEEKLLIKNIKKFQNVLNLNEEYLNNIASDYASNKQLLSLLESQQALEYYLQNNSLMNNLNISYFAVFDAQKSFLAGHYYDIHSDEVLPIPDELKMFIKNHEGKFVNQNQYMTLSFEKILFSVKPLYEKNSIKGYLFVARTIDSAFLTSISEVIQDYVMLINSYTQKIFKQVALGKNSIEFDMIKISDEYLLSHIKLYDMLEKKYFFIQLRHQRQMYQDLIQDLINNLFALLVTFLSIFMLFYLFMNRLFTQRIAYITNKIKQASKDESLKVQLQVTYDDELSYLCRKINEMFEDIRLHQSKTLQRERDFLQSVLDTQQNIIMITDGKNINSANKKFKELFDSKESFFDSVALLDHKTKSNLIAVAKRYKNQDKAARFKVVNEHRYFTFDVSRLDIKQYLICMNDVSNLNKKINHLEQKASIDGLTGVYNKSTITNMAKNWLHNRSFCLMIFDIDFFKKINDTYGHYIGDCVLRDLSKIIANAIPSEDVIGRFGGEEFVLLINISTSKYLQQIANRIRELVQNHAFVYDDMRLNITISLGATLCHVNEEFTQVYKRADKSLYEAKQNGRNQVIIAA